MNYIKRLFTSLIRFVFILIVSFYLSGCGEDNIVQPQEDHFEPVGLFILVDGNTTDTILRVFQGVVNPADTLKAPFNILSEHLEVYFWDENRNVLASPTGGQTLGFAIRDAAVVETVMDSPTDFAFHIRGLSLSPDTTSMQIKVIHQGHADFTTPYVPVKVDECEIPDPAGFVIIDTVTNGIIYRDSLGTVTGDTVRINSGSSTNRMEIFYFDTEGNRFQPCLSEYTLSAIANPAGIANFTSKPGEWTFKFEAVSAGNTLITLRLFKGANLFYGTRNIPVKVNP